LLWICPFLETFVLHLSLIDGVGPATVGHLVTFVKQQGLSDLYGYTARVLAQIPGISHTMASKLLVGLQDSALLEAELAKIEKHGISWVTCYDAGYPELLTNIYLPPVVLYWRGTLDTHDPKKIAVVGSRKASAYGQNVIDTLFPALVTSGWTIVSGGALGADTLAHQSALAYGGKTIVVLGSGLLCPYPMQNKKLFDTIGNEGGAVVSSFPLTMQPSASNFPARNRIISGLSRGTLVVQAAAQSGALITAQYALEQGREVFAVPGPIDEELSVGCHALVQQGAKLVTCTQDLLTEFGEQVIEGVIEIPEHVEQGGADLYDQMRPEQRVILKACRVPCATQELLDLTKLELVELHAALFDLQLQGKLAQGISGMWQATK
jgi:DNA processing protein